MRIVKAALVIDGVGKLVRQGNGSLTDLLKDAAAHPKIIPTAAFAQQLAGRAGPGVAEAVIGPKVVDGIVKLASKGEPAIGRVARAKLMKIGG